LEAEKRVRLAKEDVDALERFQQTNIRQGMMEYWFQVSKGIDPMGRELARRG